MFSRWDQWNLWHVRNHINASFSCYGPYWSFINPLNSTLCKIFSRRYIEIFFLIFPRKHNLTLHANCHQWRQLAWMSNPYFLKKKKWENYFNISFLPRVLNVKDVYTGQNRHLSCEERRGFSASLRFSGETNLSKFCWPLKWGLFYSDWSKFFHFSEGFYEFFLLELTFFSLPGRSPGGAIALPPASVSASTYVKVF